MRMSMRTMNVTVTVNFWQDMNSGNIEERPSRNQEQNPNVKHQVSLIILVLRPYLQAEVENQSHQRARDRKSLN